MSTISRERSQQYRVLCYEEVPRRTSIYLTFGVGIGIRSSYEYLRTVVYYYSRKLCGNMGRKDKMGTNFDPFPAIMCNILVVLLYYCIAVLEFTDVALQRGSNVIARYHGVLGIFSLCVDGPNQRARLPIPPIEMLPIPRGVAINPSLHDGLALLFFTTI